MKSVKPGRGPSFMGGIGGIAATVFGVIWTVMAGSMGAPGLFTAFGVVFTLLAGAQTVYAFVNATGKNRFSTFDITDADEEPDPLNARFGGEEAAEKTPPTGRYCPFCGAQADVSYAYCPECGKELPR